MEYQWNEQKNARNIVKHGIDFEEAVEIFEGMTLHLPSRQRNLTEDRFVAIGKMGPFVLTVVYTIRGEGLRIISARRACRAEREFYEAELHKVAATARDDGRRD